MDYYSIETTSRVPNPNRASESSVWMEHSAIGETSTTDNTQHVPVRCDQTPSLSIHVEATQDNIAPSSVRDRERDIRGFRNCPETSSVFGEILCSWAHQGSVGYGSLMD
ncbi:hypothetical protein LF1_23950 [Rubripirellula obstinata]|uniref:Uncharacterized protein n=1 Tax=Rubripirellula obstinata TaxID=406547 RepID=A0A5B1CF93_9BACT|nr:hypothetical protein LF1_23950 [Rubripirellula obstinata]